MTRQRRLQPLIILGSPRSFTSLICAMVGQHPALYGVPELNLFIGERLRDLVDELGGFRQIQIHGLVRTVAQLYAGEQTMNSVDMARRWILTRLNCSTGEIYRELCDAVAPLRLVDKSPVYALKPEYLARIRQSFPDAFFLHLIRHPRTQGESIMKVAKGLMAVLSNSIDYSTEPPTVDPQISWYSIQRNILRFLEDVDPRHKLTLRGEDVLNERERHLGEICRWLDIDDGPAALEAMLHPERSPYACLGPLGAHLGNDLNFLRAPELRVGRIGFGDLDGALPWRGDGREFDSKVKHLARALGYR